MVTIPQDTEHKAAQETWEPWCKFMAAWLEWQSSLPGDTRGEQLLRVAELLAWGSYVATIPQDTEHKAAEEPNAAEHYEIQEPKAAEPSAPAASRSRNSTKI